jgi:hypothetical protein
MSGDMRRVERLDALIKLNEPLAAIEADVSQLPWDDQSSSVVLTKEDVRSVLERYMSTALSPREVEQWANLLEGREDVTMEQSVRDVIYQLANPILEGELSPIAARSLITGPLGGL